jgi:hypothetical protein
VRAFWVKPTKEKTMEELTDDQALAAFENHFEENKHEIRSEAIPYIVGKQMVQQVDMRDRSIKVAHFVDRRSAKTAMRIRRWARFCTELAVGEMNYKGERVSVTLYYVWDVPSDDLDSDEARKKYFWQID